MIIIDEGEGFPLICPGSQEIDVKNIPVIPAESIEAIP